MILFLKTAPLVFGPFEKPIPKREPTVQTKPKPVSAHHALTLINAAHLHPSVGKQTPARHTTLHHLTDNTVIKPDPLGRFGTTNATAKPVRHIINGDESCVCVCVQCGSFNEAAIAIIVIIWLPCAPRARARASRSLLLRNEWLRNRGGLVR